MAQFATLVQLCLASVLKHSNLPYSGSAALSRQLVSIAGHGEDGLFDSIVQSQVSEKDDRDPIVEFLTTERYYRQKKSNFLGCCLFKYSVLVDNPDMMMYAIENGCRMRLSEAQSCDVCDGTLRCCAHDITDDFRLALCFVIDSKRPCENIICSFLDAQNYNIDKMFEYAIQFDDKELKDYLVQNHDWAFQNPPPTLNI
jgi:hypothetical protein